MSQNTIPKQNNEDAITRTLILAEAVKLFAQKGFNGVSMRDLASAAKITPGALYYHFPSKKELHEATVKYAYQESSTPAVSSLMASEMEPMEILESFILRLCERFYEDSDFRRLVQWILLDCETNDNIRNIIIKVVYEKHYDSLTSFLEKLAPDSNPYRLTTFIFGMVLHNYFNKGIRKHHKRNYKEERETPAEVTREIMQLLQHGIFQKK